MNGQEEKTLYEVIQVPKETGVRFFTSVDKGSYIPNHLHRAVEIIYMLEGELMVSIENTMRKVCAGQCILVNSNVVHGTKCIVPNKAIVLQIPIDFAKLYIPDIQKLMFVIDDPSESKIRQTKAEMFKKILIQMQIIDEIRPKGYALKFNSLLFELLYRLYHDFSIQIFKADLTQREKDAARLDKILQYTAENYSRPISIEEIAGVAFLQTRYFCRFFKKCMGLTFLEYQNELRLSYIYRDLINTEDPVSRILERHGFTNYKLFRRMFAEHFGDTPTRVRKRREGGSERD